MVVTLTMRRNIVELVNIKIFYHMLHKHILVEFRVCPGEVVIEECITCNTVQ